MLEILSCEIEETLSPSLRRESFTNYVYQIVRPHLSSGGRKWKDCDIQAYIAVEKNVSPTAIPPLSVIICWDWWCRKLRISAGRSRKGLAVSLWGIQWNRAPPQTPVSRQDQTHHQKHIPPFLILRDIFEQTPTVSWKYWPVSLI